MYNDFLKAFEQILDSDVKIMRPRPHSSGSYRDYRTNDYGDDDDGGGEDGDRDGDGGLRGHRLETNGVEGPGFRRGKPLVVWVMGGPGSDKTERIREVAALHPTWKVISVGQVLLEYLREIYPEDGERGGSVREPAGEDGTASMIRSLVRKGDMVPQGTILDLVVEEMSSNAELEGFFITGFPRDIIQAQSFEERV